MSMHVHLEEEVIYLRRALEAIAQQGVAWAEKAAELAPPRVDALAYWQTRARGVEEGCAQIARAALSTTARAG